MWRALVAGGCGGASPSSLDYRGTANGVLITLNVPGKKSVLVGVQPKLSLHFTAAAGTAWRHVLHVRKQEAFCIWPEGSGSEMSTIDVHVAPKNLALTLPSLSTSTGVYTCGLRARTGGAAGSWSSYVGAALVSARLRQAHN